ncbi:HNH endonuclease [Spiroplasma alleghenense]|uniref:HNH nuclease domain-containing protein n=1 Tax=Spiroplasma alleghenense TaxID=216931 RepID=A0A345Z594_9MOLU|nr:HNH endonuclease signature motif containing protein [Spiroplasma alleghenense]AXK51773.1 hypothetical protein SALLE_v1c11030 [Spiroplasma alleghenense]
MSEKIRVKMIHEDKTIDIVLYLVGFVLVKFEVIGKKANFKNIFFDKKNLISFEVFKNWFYLPYKIKTEDFKIVDEIDFYNKYKEFLNINFNEQRPKYGTEEMKYLTAFYLINNRNNSYAEIFEKENWIKFINIKTTNLGFIRGWRSYAAKIDNIKFYDPKSIKGRSGIKNELANDKNSRQYIRRKEINLICLYSFFEDDIEKAVEFLYGSAFSFDQLLDNSKINEIEFVNEKNVEIVTRDPMLQSRWRKRLIEIFGSCCISNCKITNNELLVASHIKPYSQCKNSEKFDLNNGLILCANHDKLFDRFLISFDSEKLSILISKNIYDDISTLNINSDSTLIGHFKSPEFIKYLKFHNLIWDIKNKDTYNK